MSWTYTLPSKQGRYLVYDKLWGFINVGFYHPDMQRPWCVNGAWLPKEAVTCWQPLPPMPKQP